MMKKPWQIWSLFALILCVVLPAMVWLTVQINQADQFREQDRVETELARRKAELQERINSALYRMDFWATPLVAQEAARPYYLYEPFYQLDAESRLPKSVATSKTKEQLESVQRTSPLVYETSEYVVMHFQVSDKNLVTSPQACGDFALSCGVSSERMLDNNSNFEKAKAFCGYEIVAAGCVELPQPDSDPATSELGFATVYRDPSFNRFANPYGAANGALGQQINSVPELNGSKSMQQANRNLNRGSTEYAKRAQTATMNAQSQWLSNQLNLSNEPDSLIREGVMRPMWLDGKLLLARRVEGKDRKLVQCCWLNWEKIRETLKSEISELLPEAEFEPVLNSDETNFSRAMATLPVQLVVDSPKMLSTLALQSPQTIGSSTSGLKMSLWLAWIGLGIAAMASAMLLMGVLQLSERRATFVSAVTHELRTPLTTFRMYSEMLAEKMVPEEKQQEYAETMKTEADRLSHLVENVLQYAQLERGNNTDRLAEVTLDDLVSRFENRLRVRAQEADMQLVIDLGGHAKSTVKTDPCKVEQVLFNLVDNACKYARTCSQNKIELTVNIHAGRVIVTVRDYGPGVAPRFRRLLFKPFCKSDQDAAETAAGVGLGLALCQRMASSLGGRIYLAKSESGSRFVFEFPAT